MSKISHNWMRMAVILGAIYLIAFVAIAVVRLFYPFDIEWMEGGMLTHAVRLQVGEPIYAAPSSDFVPFFYTPGYPAVVAALGTVVGEVDFWLGRAVSLLATLGTMGIIFGVVRREANGTYALLAVGIYAALFRTCGAFFDLARPDAMYIFLVAAGVALVYYGKSTKMLCLAASVFVIAFFTKQTSSVFVPPLLIYLFTQDWRRALLFGALVFGGGALGVYVLNHQTDGWFWVYIFEGHQGHLFYWKNILMEYWRDVLFLCPMLLLLPLLWFGYRVPVLGLSLLLVAHWSYAFYFRASTLDYVPHMYYRELFYEEPRWLILVPPVVIGVLCASFRWFNREIQSDELKTGWFWLLMYVAGVGASAMNHSTQWAYSNCFMPIALFSAILIPLGLRDLMEVEGRRHTWLLPVAVVFQLLALAYNPLSQVPTSDDYAALERLDARLAGISGSVFMPAHPLYSFQRDGETHLHQMGINDVAFLGGVKDLNARLRGKAWGAVVVDDRLRLAGLEPHYYVADELSLDSPDALRTKTGFLLRPKTIWRAQDPSPRDVVLGVSGNFEGSRLSGWAQEADGFSSTHANRQIRGRQGRRLLASKRQFTGSIKSLDFRVRVKRLSYMLACQGPSGGELRLYRGSEVIHRRRCAGPGRTRLRRAALDLSGFLGDFIRIELHDLDPKGAIYLDDLRLDDQLP